MKKYVDGKYLDMSDEDIKQDNYLAEMEYGELVDIYIRRKYNMSQEFAILRQRDTKPEEFKAYFSYCETCKRVAREEVKKQNG